MFNPSRMKNGDYTPPEVEVILLESPDIITTTTPIYNENVDENAWT